MINASNRYTIKRILKNISMGQSRIMFLNEFRIIKVKIALQFTKKVCIAY